MRKPGRPDLAPVRPLAPVTDDVHAHLPLGRLDRGVCLPWRDGVSLCEEQEMVDQGFHVFLHGCARWRGHLVVLHPDGPGRHFVQALNDYAQALAELLHPAEVAIIAIPVHAHGDIELHIPVRVIRLRFSNVPGDAAAAQHHAGEGVVERVGGGDDADAFGAPDPDPVVGEEFFGFVDAVTELGRPLVDVVEEAEGEVGVYAAGTDVGGVEAGAGDALVELLSGLLVFPCTSLALRCAA